MKILTAILLVITSGFVVSCDKDDDTVTTTNNTTLNSIDRTFMMQASIGNNAEVQAAMLAVMKTSTPQVLAFAQHMIMEHGMAQTELKTLGTNVGVSVGDAVDSSHAAMGAMLATLSGREFDSTYMHAQVMDHQMVNAQFQNELSNGNHESVKAYANTNLPHIQSHLARADSIATNMF